MSVSKVDANQPEIVRMLRDAGASVTLLHEVGKGCPDAVVGWRGVNYLIEFKMPGFEHRLTKDEKTWFEEWHGQAAIASSFSAVCRIIGMEDNAT